MHTCWGQFEKEAVRSWEFEKVKNEVKQVADQERDFFLNAALGEVKVAEAKLEPHPIGWKEWCTCSSTASSGAELKSVSG